MKALTFKWEWFAVKVYQVNICSYIHMFFVKKITNDFFFICEIFTNVNSYMSSRSYVLEKKLLVKKITNKSAYIVKNFTNCSTNTKLFWNENAYKFSITVFLWRISQSAEEISPDQYLFMWLNLQTLSKWRFSQVLAFSLWKKSQWKQVISLLWKNSQM